VSFPEGASSKNLLNMLGRVEPFTSEENFTITVWPKRKEGKR
jgi:hypothetical protein